MGSIPTRWLSCGKHTRYPKGIAGLEPDSRERLAIMGSTVSVHIVFAHFLLRNDMNRRDLLNSLKNRPRTTFDWGEMERSARRAAKIAKDRARINSENRDKARYDELISELKASSSKEIAVENANFSEISDKLAGLFENLREIQAKIENMITFYREVSETQRGELETDRKLTETNWNRNFEENDEIKRVVAGTYSTVLSTDRSMVSRFEKVSNGLDELSSKIGDVLVDIRSITIPEVSFDETNDKIDRVLERKLPQGYEVIRDKNGLIEEVVPYYA